MNLHLLREKKETGNNQDDIGNASHRSMIGLKYSHHLLNQSKAKVKLTAI